METEIWQQESGEKRQEPSQPIRVGAGNCWRDLFSFAERKLYIFPLPSLIQPLVCFIFFVNVLDLQLHVNPVYCLALLTINELLQYAWQICSRMALALQLLRETD